jgi:hypothetical protein
MNVVKTGGTMTMKQKINPKFPKTVWESDGNNWHYALKLSPTYVGNPNYAVYISADGTILKRFHVEEVGVSIFPRKIDALRTRKRRLESQLQWAEEYIKRELTEASK